MSEAELRRISGGNPAVLIDRRKPSFRALGLGDKPLSEKEALALMAQNPSIIRRPIYEIDGKVLIGVKEADLLKHLK